MSVDLTQLTSASCLINCRSICFASTTMQTPESTFLIGTAEELLSLFNDNEKAMPVCAASSGSLPALKEAAQKRDVPLLTTDQPLYTLYSDINEKLTRFHAWELALAEGISVNNTLQYLVNVAAVQIKGSVFLLNKDFELICIGDAYGPDSGRIRETLEAGRLRVQAEYAPAGSQPFPVTIGERVYWLQHVPKQKGEAEWLLYYSPLNFEAVDAAVITELLGTFGDHIRSVQTWRKYADGRLDTLINAIVEGKITTVQQVTTCLDCLPIPTERFFNFVIIHPNSWAGQHSRSNAKTLMSARLQSFFGKCNSAYINDTLVLLLSATDRQQQPYPEIDLNGFESILAEYDAFASFSNSTSRKDMLGTCYLLARSTMHLGTMLRLKPASRIFYFEDYAEYIIIDLCQNSFKDMLGHDDIVYLTHPDAVKVYRYDLSHQTNLMDVLYYYCIYSGNVSAACKAAYMHRNTFSSWLTRLRRLIKADLEDGETRQRMIFSYKIFRYYERCARVNMNNQFSVSPPIREDL